MSAIHPADFNDTHRRCPKCKCLRLAHYFRSESNELCNNCQPPISAPKPKCLLDVLLLKPWTLPKLGTT